jgi:hypothetical protein
VLGGGAGWADTADVAARKAAVAGPVWAAAAG